MAARAREPALVVDVAVGVHGHDEAAAHRTRLRGRAVGCGRARAWTRSGTTSSSGTVEEASGEMTVFEATCDPEPRLSVAVDATLASKPGRPKVQVEGGLASLIPG